MPKAAIPRIASRRSKTPGKQPPRQVPAKSRKEHRTIIPMPHVERIRERFISGQSIRKLAREESRDQETVSKIVKAPEMQAYVQNLREKYYGLGDLALDGLRRALQNSKDGRIAADVLRSIGVIPSVEEAQALTRPTQAASPETEEEKVKAEMVKLVTVAWERAKMFNMPAPTLLDDEVGEAIPLEKPEDI